jgi:NAD+ synthase
MLAPSGVLIPPAVIDKPPSAELRENQRDDDSLPPYPVLDAILDGLVDRDCSAADLIASGFDAATVKRIEHLLYLAEYKRYQAPPGTRLTARAPWAEPDRIRVWPRPRSARIRVRGDRL